MLILLGVGLAVILAGMTGAVKVAQAAPAHVMPVVVVALPPADVTLNASPDSVVLTFNCLLSDEGTSLIVLNEDGQRVDQQDGHVDPANRFRLVVSLPPLPEGRYQVAYSAVSLGGSTVLVSGYEFRIDLPDPILEVLSPVNGQAFEAGAVPLQMQVRFFDFNQFNNRIHLYVDGQFMGELRTLDYLLEGLEPGVHEIRVVLARFEDEELPETASVLIVAIAQPDPETTGWEQAALAPPDPGLQLTPMQAAGVITAVVVLLAIGLWIGRTH